jgi:pimeloyl-ACP methyl ester carboxylesterase
VDNSSDRIHAFLHFARDSLLIFLRLLLILIVVAFTIDRILQAQSFATLPYNSLLVEIEGRKIHFSRQGAGNPGPAVILIPGQPGNATPDSGWWASVQPALAKSLRVYAYDEPGYAWSDPGPQPFSNLHSSEDLQAALTALGEQQVVLVSFANGNLTALDLYARHPNPSQILAMLWIDADQPSPDRIAMVKKSYASVQGLIPLARFLTELGLGRFFLYDRTIEPAEASLLKDLLNDRTRNLVDWDYYNRVAATRGNYKVLQATLDRASNSISDLEYAAKIPLPVDIPVFTIQTGLVRELKTLSPAAKAVVQQQAAWYKAVAGASRGGKYIHIPGSSHLIMFEQPEVVVQAVEELMAQVKGN